MNSILAKKILQKLTLEELYNEIKSNDKMILTVGLMLINNEKLFISIVREFIESTIKNNKNIETEYLKSVIIDMDGEDFQVNSVIKKNTSTKTNPQTNSVSDATCGIGFRRTSGC